MEKKRAGKITILQMCTINDNHMMHDSWDIERYRQFFLSFWTIFCLFTPPPPLISQKFKIKNIKIKPGDVIILHMCTINNNHVMYGSWDTEHDRQNFLSLSAIFWTFTPSRNPKIQNFEQMKKTHQRYYHFTLAYQKSWSYAILFLRYDMWQM